ncbi:ER membrane protein complex subunit 10 [Hydra vulgaris]|uniref:ER membrane protein complex subunit 10 n=1 Tax=Hydra vulgaris TaxID=6087 RepID=A0ABM4CHU0_HYDVU
MFKVHRLVSFIGVCLALIFCKRIHDDESSFSASNTNFKILIEHAFGVQDTFTPKGKVLVKANRAGGGASATLIEEFTLNENDFSKLSALVKENGLYFIRTLSHNQDDVSKSQLYVSTFVKACYLVGSGMNEKISISIDNENNILGLSLISPSSDCNNNHKKLRMFNSTVHIIQQIPGSIPDTQSFSKKESEQRNDKGKVEENQSFIGKYWMYILPVFLILLLSAQAEPPAEGSE